MNETILRLNNEAGSWDNGSPIGGGSFGAVLFGGAKTEKIDLNEETIWSESPIAPPDPEFRKKIQRLRDMYLAGETYIDDEAERLLGDSMQCVKSYESAGVVELCLPEFGEVKHYKRELDLEHAVFSCAAQYACGTVKEEAFCSYPYEITAVKYTFPAAGSVKIAFTREFTDAVEYNGGVLEATCHTGYGNHRFAVGVKPLSDGAVSFADGCLRVENAKTLTLFIAIATEYNYGDGFLAELREILVEAEDYAAIKANHIEDFAALFHESSVSFAEADPSLRRMAAGERIARLRDDPAAVDPGLYELYFNFGKYLLISSSRDGTLPANLQGVWAEKLENPWNADYHTNINLQMNYWPAEVLGLGECHAALFDYMNGVLLESGRETAKALYGCRGTVTHHLSDLYGYTAPADGLWGLWPLGGAWLSTHMWEHYLFTEDLDFLRETAYEYMKACAEFFLDYLFADATGTLCSGPSMSPENRYYIDTPEGRKEGYLCFSPTMDVEIITHVLQNYVAAEDLLGVDPETKAAAAAALNKLPKLKVGANGTLNEWPEEYEEPEPGHRHISHAYGLYPGNMITAQTPELFAAIRKTLERRLSFGGGHTGWSRAWLICLYARLGLGKEAYSHLRALLTNSTLPSLLDTHPPFQIDGNFGGSAGIAEALLQSHDGVVTVLPAAPGFLSGEYSGLRARGNLSVGARFEAGRAAAVTLSSPTATEARVVCPGAAALISDGKKYLPKDGVFTLPVSPVPATFTAE
jgi:alpha-L-fucosidase 2